MTPTPTPTQTPTPTTASSGADRPDVRTVVGVLRERNPAERRVAMTPDAVQRLTSLGLDVVVQAGAGTSAWFPDQAYVDAGAELADADAVVARCDVLVCIGAPDVTTLRAGQVLVGLLAPLVDHDLVAALTASGVTAISLDGLPRTLSSAQSMDVLTSQANVAGYKAALLAAESYGGYLPMLMTAAGTVRPAKVLVIGAGVAGLQAIGTARRLGAVVTGYDVRDAARADVASTGATFLDLKAAGRPAAGAAEGGYARELNADEQAAQQDALGKAVATFDVVITTAQVPGRRPPVLVSEAAVAAMAAGSVIVDLGAGPLGGNVVGSVPDTTTVTANGVTVIGAGSLPSTVPHAASTAYARNIAALLAHLVVDGRIHLDPADAITAGTLVTDAGAVVRPDLLDLHPPHTDQTAGDLVTAAAGSPR